MTGKAAQIVASGAAVTGLYAAGQLDVGHGNFSYAGYFLDVDTVTCRSKSMSEYRF